MTDFIMDHSNLFIYRKIKYPAACSGVFDPRGSRQISMQAWLLGSLLAGIKNGFMAPNLFMR